MPCLSVGDLVVCLQISMLSFVQQMFTCLLLTQLWDIAVGCWGAHMQTGGILAKLYSKITAASSEQFTRDLGI